VQSAAQPWKVWAAHAARLRKGAIDRMKLRHRNAATLLGCAAGRGRRGRLAERVRAAPGWRDRRRGPRQGRTCEREQCWSRPPTHSSRPLRGWPKRCSSAAKGFLARVSARIPQIGCANRRVHADFRGCTARDASTLDQDRDTIGKPKDSLLVVLHEQQTELVPRKVEDPYEPLSIPGCHTGEGLVEKKEFGLGGERDREFEQCSLPMGELRCPAVGQLEERQAVQDEPRRFVQLAIGVGWLEQAQAAPQARLDRDGHVFEDGEAREYGRNLKGSAEAETGASVGQHSRDVPAVEEDPTRVGPDLAGQQAQECGLPGSVRADDGVVLSATDFDVEIRGSDDGAETLRKSRP